ncbi:response regulator receiver protein [Marinimicrobium locisalis]|uniref:response regulator receiver protein n=1 Tax=Marinimicrobium locisalis TaxID=546022 RepID=UPI003221E14D
MRNFKQLRSLKACTLGTLSVLLLSLSFPASSDNQWHSSTIKKVYPFQNGAFAIIFDEPSRCNKDNGYHTVKAGSNGVTEEAVDRFLSVALTAGSLGNKLFIYYDDTHPNCAVRRLNVAF